MRKEFRMLSWVERWAIAPRHHHQSVAEHSFFVALYCSQICHMLNIKLVDRSVVLDAALRHDASEAWESDVPGPAKRSLFDEQKHAQYKAKFADAMDDYYRFVMLNLEEGGVSSLIHDWGEDAPHYFAVKDIVKVADLIDEVYFLAFEQNLGNNLVRGLYQREMARLDQAALALAGETFAGKLMDEIGTQISRIGEEGAIIPANDSDMPQDPSFKGTSTHVADADASGAIEPSVPRAVLVELEKDET